MKWIKEGDILTVYLNDKEYRAFELIKFGRDLGLSPQSTFKEMKESKLSGNEMRAGMKAYKMGKGGADIINAPYPYEFRYHKYYY